MFEPASPRLTLLDGIEVEAPLEGTLLVIKNADKPGVIGQIGSILGRHGVNIANFALGRDEAARWAWSSSMRRRTMPDWRARCPKFGPRRRSRKPGSRGFREAGYSRNASRRTAPVSRSLSSTASAATALTR